MTFTQILANANVLGDYLLGGTSEKRTVSLTADNVKIVLPVTPRKYNIETEQMNKIVDILDFGEALIFGNAKLKKIKFGIFLPATVHNYPFVVGDRTQAARKLDFTFIQDDRDSLLPIIEYNCGYTVHGFDDDGNLRFVGNIYQVERDRAKSEVHCVAYDNCFILNRSKSTKKFTDALPEEIAAQVCREMGVLPGSIAKTGEKVSFIANSKTGYQIILSAYTEAHKKNKKRYQVLMNADKLDVIEKGTLIENFDLDSSKNMTDSIYRESIERLINQVQVVDDKGNGLEYIKDEESIQKHSVFSTIYKQDPNKYTNQWNQASEKFHRRRISKSNGIISN